MARDAALNWWVGHRTPTPVPTDTPFGYAPEALGVTPWASPAPPDMATNPYSGGVVIELKKLLLGADSCRRILHARPLCVAIALLTKE